MKRNQAKGSKMDQNTRSSGSSGNTTPQDGQYRESSSSNGTAVNNSNSTNYNSNNVTNAPTGAGSNPNTTGSPTTSTSPGNSGSSTQNSSGAGSSSSSDPNNGAGTAAAVSGARTTETPAVKAGSTVRNTSIGDFVSSSPNYTTLQNALQSAGLDEMFKGNGSYTVFAPSNSAFKKLPDAVQSKLLEGSNRDALKQLLSYHVMQGSVDVSKLSQQIKAGNGKARLTTLAGSTLTVQMGTNGRVTLTDEQGGTATVESADNRQSNGVVHGIDAVLMPKAGASAFR